MNCGFWHVFWEKLRLPLGTESENFSNRKTDPLIFFSFRFARVGDNYILKSDPEEQTFRVSKIVKHGNFKPLGSGNDGDGRNDIALVCNLNSY